MCLAPFIRPLPDVDRALALGPGDGPLSERRSLAFQALIETRIRVALLFESIPASERYRRKQYRSLETLARRYVRRYGKDA